MALVPADEVVNKTVVASTDDELELATIDDPEVATTIEDDVGAALTAELMTAVFPET